MKKWEDDGIFDRWKEVFIDPGVYDLIKSDKFKWEGSIDIEEFLDSLPDDHYFSWDYPCDMNLKYQDIFLQKTYDNAKKYCKFPQYIVTAQYKFNHYWNFVEWFNIYNELDIQSGILGLGNMCRFRSLNQYLKHTLDYAFKTTTHPRMHIYGLCLKAIPYAVDLAKRFNIELSIDNTKWTRACTVELKEKYNKNCNGKNRQEFFDVYKGRIEELLRDTNTNK
jgi:hypothetical protein